MTGTQRRGRRIMMTPHERDTFLAEQRTCRVATVGADGTPHVGALWFAWDGTALWLYSITRSKRWAQLRENPRIAVVVDDGHDYGELRGVELTGSAAFVGEVPRTGDVCAELDVPERLFTTKYFGGLGLEQMPYDGRHAWLRLVPEAVVSWDFRKMPG
ncbi:pyridoxamine 5'-phosphate oxidase family protein [Streptomyces monomycini]|uniref:pyridoxamine 5'-phosphate oxidase family protein n=1 Tax=Streptomyces monomycini TaxID=371720 RepID=UPI0004AABFCE|nr:pyridoxamine 5'-phosphate oxidase family protein [Streptomyces monomycini]